jgi:hypothetical protein
MAKIYLMTFRDPEFYSGKYDIVSHGIHEDTFQNITMQQELLEYYIQECGAKQDESGEYFIEG